MPWLLGAAAFFAMYLLATEVVRGPQGTVQFLWLVMIHVLALLVINVFPEIRFAFQVHDLGG